MNQKLEYKTPVELKIDKLVYGGEGLAKFNDVAVFISDTAPGDIVESEIISVKKNYAKALLKEIIKPSEHRVKPFCPYAKVCGGCQWQHINYEEQLRIKKSIVQECLGNDIPVKDIIKSDETQNFRCKIQLPVLKGKAGYYKKGTHEIVNIKYCPVQPAIIDDVTEFLRQKVQELNLRTIRHFVFRYSKTNHDFILTLVINDNKISENLIKLAKSAAEKFKQLAGVAVNFNTSNTNVILGTKSMLIEGRDYIEETLDNKVFKISHDAFFQVNPLTAAKMFSEVRDIVKQRVNSPDILDIYAGSGSFSIYLSDIAREITAIEESTSSVEDGKVNIARNKINNISYINANADKSIPDRKVDVTVLDPPRKGCSGEVLEAVKQNTDKLIVYISCNPSTLARDYKILSDKFKAEFVQPVDMFPHTYHVESILVMTKRFSYV